MARHGDTRRGRLEAFGELLLPDEAAEPILAAATRGVLLEWLEEIWAEDELAAVGVTPRRRMLLDGPPGVGKTTLAHHLAARLGIPMLEVRPEKIQSKWVHQTGEQLGELFDLAQAGVSLADSAKPVPLLLFLDEFDSYAGQRKAADTTAGELRNQEVNVLLQRIDAFPGYLIGATNFGEHVDQAVWRRFHLRLSLALPGPGERALILKRYLAPFALPQSHLRRVATESLEGASPALIREFCENLKRQLVVGPKLGRDMNRAAVLQRVLLSCPPHPEIGKPRLWSFGSEDKAWAGVPWPLPLAFDLVGVEEVAIAPDDAEALGREAYLAGEEIVANPFPFGDPCRPRWDKGWRDESGGDGMGPQSGEIVTLPRRRP